MSVINNICDLNEPITIGDYVRISQRHESSPCLCDSIVARCRQSETAAGDEREAVISFRDAL
jgi:hypothetical protein